MSKAVGDQRYFSNTRGKGEIHELKEELNSTDRNKVLEAVKKVIAHMTVGKDVSSLFPYVVKNMQNENLELKKLVYLYLMNYARSNPDLAILSINTFVTDATSHRNPLVRALAIRTMGCIRDATMSQQLAEPLSRALKDDDPYVRKTAATCVAKLYDINPEECLEGGFLEQLRSLLGDANPMVVANCVASLVEIRAIAGPSAFPVDKATKSKLLAALGECTEWGQIYVLNALALYKCETDRDAEDICERVAPRLAHSNAAVVLNAVKVILKNLPKCSQEFQRSMQKKLAPPLVTLLSADPEIQYVALRNIDLIVQSRPTILAHEIRVFFCKYNDSVYVKLEKLEIMIKLSSERNIEQVLNEFKEYAQEVDVEFVRRSVRAIGRCAIKLESAAERCIRVLLDLIKTKVNYVVQEAIIVIKDIFRRYPGKYETIIGDLCENLESLDEPEAKASMIWIIGEYADRIDNADELLETFLDTFVEEPTLVQLQLLTATVKLFLKAPEGAQEMVQRVLNLGTQESDNPDLRDRAYVYWRLLSTDPEAAKKVVLSEKPLIADDTNKLDPSLLSTLLGELSHLASVFHKPAEAFVSKIRSAKAARAAEGVEDDDDDDADDAAEAAQQADQAKRAIAESKGEVPAASTIGNLLDLDLSTPAPSAPAAGGADPLADMFGSAPAGGAKTVRKVPLLAGDKGTAVSGAFVSRNGVVSFEVTIENRSQAPGSGYAFQFNKNSYGIAPGGAITGPASLAPGQSGEFVQPISVGNAEQIAPGAATSQVQVAIKTPSGVEFFIADCPLSTLFSNDGTMEPPAFLQAWKAIPDVKESTKQVNDVPNESVDALVATARTSNVFFIARREVDGQSVIYLSAKALGVPLLTEITFTPGSYSVKMCTRTTRDDLVPLFETAMEGVLRGV